MLASLKIQTVQIIALVEYWGVAGVEILGRVVSHGAGAKAQYPLSRGHYGEHHPVPVRIVVLIPALALYYQARREQMLIGVAFFRHIFEQVVPSWRSIAKAELSSGSRIYIPPHQVLLGFFAFLAQKLGMVEHCGILAGGVQPFLESPLLPEPVVVHVIRKLHARPLSQILYCLHIGKLFRIHNELHHAPACVTTKAVVELLVRHHGKRRRLFAVERAAAPKPFALWLKQSILGGDSGKVAFAEQLA